MVDSLDQAKLVWRSEEIGLSGCMYPGGNPGTGWCDPIIADGRVFVSWFRRAGPDLVDLHALPASRGWASLIDPPDDPEAFARGGGHRTSLPSKEMSAIQRHIRADDIITCLDDRTGKKLWERVFPARGINNVRVYGALCVPCVKDGRVYAIGSSMRVYALDAAAGKTIWQSDIGERTEQFDQAMEVFARSRHRGSDIGTAADTSVVCADGVVAVGESSPPVEAGRGGVGLVGLDAATGRRLWGVPDCLDRLGSPAVWRHDGKEYFLAAGERMVLIEPKTGKELWSVGGKDDRITDGCAPAVSGEYVVVAKNVAKTVGANPAKWWRGPSCYRLSLDGAKLVWALPMVDGISLIAPAIMGKHAYVCVNLKKA
jgi:outer membrane protein assembly factor BamB